MIEQRDLPRYGLLMARDMADADEAEEGEVPVGDVRDLKAGESAEEELSLIGVLKALATNRRGMTGFMATFIYGLVDGALDPT